MLEQTTADVKVRLIGVLGSAAPSREMRFAWSESLTVSKLVEELVKTVGSYQFEELLIDSATKDPRPNVIILLNDQDCNLFSGLGPKVEQESTVTIIPVAHGG